MTWSLNQQRGNQFKNRLAIDNCYGSLGATSFVRTMEKYKRPNGTTTLHANLGMEMQAKSFWVMKYIGYKSTDDLTNETIQTTTEV